MRAPILITASFGLALVTLFGANEANAQHNRNTYIDYDDTPAPTYRSQDRYESRRSVKRVKQFYADDRQNYRHVRYEERLRRTRRKIVRRIMRRADYNGDNYISRYEARRTFELDRKFHRIDYNRDGYISRRELRSHVKRSQARKQRRRHHRSRLF